MNACNRSVVNTVNVKSENTKKNNFSEHLAHIVGRCVYVTHTTIKKAPTNVVFSRNKDIFEYLEVK